MTDKADLIRNLKRQGPFDINDVVQWTNRLLSHFVPYQHRYKVSDKVTVRIVRYYLSLDLISKPEGHKGRNAMFGSAHVIQMLAIKSLQAQYVPLKKITQIMKSVQESDLLAWLIEDDHRSQSTPSAVMKSVVDPINSSNISKKANTAMVPNRQWKRVPIHNDIELLLGILLNQTGAEFAADHSVANNDDVLCAHVDLSWSWVVPTVLATHMPNTIHLQQITMKEIH